jgi:hypothetical protein
MALLRGRTEQAPGHDVAEFVTETSGEMHDEERKKKTMSLEMSKRRQINNPEKNNDKVKESRDEK